MKWMVVSVGCSYKLFSNALAVLCWRYIVWWHRCIINHLSFPFLSRKCLTVTNINVVMMLFNTEKSILKGSDFPVMFLCRGCSCDAGHENQKVELKKKSLLFHMSCINREPGRVLKTLGLSLKFKIHKCMVPVTVSGCCMQWDSQTASELTSSLQTLWAKSELWLC